MTYEEFVTEYESLVTELLTPGIGENPELKSKFVKLAEAHPEHYKVHYEETLDERYPIERFLITL